MQRNTVYLYPETALHTRISGGISTHHQEHTLLYLQYLVFVNPLLLPAAIRSLERLKKYVMLLCAFVGFDIISKRVESCNHIQDASSSSDD